MFFLFLASIVFNVFCFFLLLIVFLFSDTSFSYILVSFLFVHVLAFSFSTILFRFVSFLYFPLCFFSCILCCSSMVVYMFCLVSRNVFSLLVMYYLFLYVCLHFFFSSVILVYLRIVSFRLFSFMFLSVFVYFNLLFSCLRLCFLSLSFTFY